MTNTQPQYCNSRWSKQSLFVKTTKRPSSISKKRITINHQTYSQCKRAEISDLLHKKQQKKLLPIVQFEMLKPNQHAGGGERVRTDDLLLAKQVLSQLSYAPPFSGNWWAWEDLNFRPHAYQACALTKLSYRPGIDIRAARNRYQTCRNCYPATVWAHWKGCEGGGRRNAVTLLRQTFHGLRTHETFP